MSVSDDTVPKMTDPPSQSSWESLRATAVKEGTTFSTTEIKPASLVGIYVCVWDDYTMLECMDDIGVEDNWIKLSIKNPKNLEDATFADIEGRFQWWRKVGAFKGMRRAEDAKENLWLVNGVSWTPIVDVDDDGSAGSYCKEDESYEKESITNDFGFASLGTLDSAGNPFFEMLYKYETGGSLKDPHPNYLRAIWKKHKEGRRGPLMLTEKEARRLQRDGAADFGDTRDFSEEIEDLDGKDPEATDDDDDDDDDDAEGDSDEGLESVNDSTSLKRRAGEDERGPEVKRHKQ